MSRMHRWASLGLMLSLQAAAVAQTASYRDWRTFTDPGARFSVLLPPGQPNASAQDTKDSGGNVTSTTYVYTMPADGCLLLAGLTEYHADIDTAIELDLDCTNFNKQVKATLITKTPITYAGHPALEFKSASATHGFRSLVVLTGPRRVFMLATGYPLTGGEPDAVQPFLASLAILKAD